MTRSKHECRKSVTKYKDEDEEDRVVPYHGGYCCGWVQIEGKMGIALKHISNPDRLCSTTRGYMKKMILKTLPNPYTIVEVKGVEKYTVQSVNESHKNDNKGLSRFSLE